jgi:hypothetical protein
VLNDLAGSKHLAGKKISRERLEEFLVAIVNIEESEGLEAPRLSDPVWGGLVRRFPDFFPRPWPAREKDRIHYAGEVADAGERLKCAWPGYLAEEMTDGVEQALLYIRRRPKRARICAREGCDQDYFFFASQPNQRYCTDVCAKAAQREFKRDWWTARGKEWRGKRKKGTKR